MSFRVFWDTASVVDADAVASRNRYYSAPLTRPGELASAFAAAGLKEVAQKSVTVRMDFENFAD